MGLINTRNLNKAKALLEKNRHKVGDLVGKATEQVDKVSKGKTSAMSAKVEDAARKYSAGSMTHQGQHPDVAQPQATPQHVDDHGAPVDDAEQRRRESEATIAAANAMKAAAEAATNMMNKAADSTPPPTESSTPPAD